jgi:hypothetical protein
LRTRVSDTQNAGTPARRRGRLVYEGFRTPRARTTPRPGDGAGDRWPPRLLEPLSQSIPAAGPRPRLCELLEMIERPYAAERDLQGYLETHPELLSAEADGNERRQWLLVRRDMGVSDRDEGPDRWSLDHLFVDQDAIPTFVEVKRNSDTRIRREVVGQMLDYAANASIHWDAGRLRGTFEARFESPEAANDELAAFVEDDRDLGAFSEDVAANVKERRLRLVFVADSIPAELRSIVEFLNEQLQLTEVIAIEIKQYVEPGGDRVNIVPRVIGETQMARRVKQTSGGARRRPRSTEERFYADMRKYHPPELAERVQSLYVHVKAHGSRQSFGTGRFPTTTAWMGEHDAPEIANPIAVTFWGDGSAISARGGHARRWNAS